MYDSSLSPAREGSLPGRSRLTTIDSLGSWYYCKMVSGTDVYPGITGAVVLSAGCLKLLQYHQSLCSLHCLLQPALFLSRGGPKRSAAATEETY